MSDKFFPIRTDTACQLKWNWSTISFREGTTCSCHRVNSDIITPDTFSLFHNTAKKILDRELMLEGHWPTGGCEYCKKIEQAGGTSDRQVHLQIPNLVPVELEQDPIATIVSPKILEIYFNNICNLSCLYCCDRYSSKIEQENKKFGRFESDGIVIENKSKKSDVLGLTEAFWNWFGINCHKLSRLHVLGGEPFYQDDFYKCLDFFESTPCPDLEFNIVSNLMVSQDKFQTVLDKLKKLVRTKKLKRFDLTASIDSFGAAQEYVRHGLNLSQWRENFEYASGQKWITLNINQTLTGLIIKQVPNLIKYINEHRQHRPIGHYFGLPVLTYNFLHPEIFGPGYFDKEFIEILDLMPPGSQKDYMQGIKSMLATSSRDSNEIYKLGKFLDEIDHRRNLNWRHVFPWLVEEIENVV
jgi:organic radical activating enzyme